MKANKYTAKDHTFAICAYKESTYLEECIQSLLKQTVKGHIILATSTPNEHIKKLVEKYGIEYYINTGEQGIAQDWNFAYHCAKTSVVTIAHQDDIYMPQFVECVLDKTNRRKRPLITFTDYGEVRAEDKVDNNRLLKIKRIMLLPLKNALLQNSKFVRRRILAFGSAICCPSVTFVKEHLPATLFKPGYRSDVDWEAWENISRQNGAFVYCDKILMYHRIHEESATTAIIADNDRTKEDFEMFCKFWPKWIARILEFFYRNSEKSNKM